MFAVMPYMHTLIRKLFHRYIQQHVGGIKSLSRPIVSCQDMSHSIPTIIAVEAIKKRNIYEGILSINSDILFLITFIIVN